MKQRLFTAAAFLAAFAFLALVLAAPLPLMERSDEVLYTQVMPRQLTADGQSTQARSIDFARQLYDRDQLLGIKNYAGALLQMTNQEALGDAPDRLYDFLHQMDFWSEEEQAELERQIAQADSWQTISDSVGFSAWWLYTPVGAEMWNTLEWELSSQGQLVRLRMNPVQEYTGQDLEHLMDEYLAVTGLDVLEDWQALDVTAQLPVDEESIVELRARYSPGAKLYLYANYVDGALAFGVCPLEQEELAQLDVSLLEE
ncbi:hypothetical protein [Allofournierella sp. CML151]|uniref:hypothetical protein n=1 Tax=Allofournierella sp. CML151 TaxID=2998082 RepID=UPI0022EB3C4E|nr:hypothetical protein [Fournierella sp. CML151]